MYRLARGGGLWLGVAATLTAALVLPGLLLPHRGLAYAAILPGIVTLFFLQFFRDPDREVAPGLASPADGKVVRIDQPDDPDVGPSDRIAIFMSPVDVHVNRFPLDGAIVSVKHHPGGHIPAWDKDSHRNERVETILSTRYGKVKVVQIAGTVARRIFPYVETGQATKGGRMGMIKLGSRCDVYVPRGKVRWACGIGKKVKAGSTSLATFTAAAQPPVPPGGDATMATRAPPSEAGE